MLMHLTHSKTPTSSALARHPHRRLPYLWLPGVAAVPHLVCSERTPCVPDCQYPVSTSRPGVCRAQPQENRLPGGLEPNGARRAGRHLHSAHALTRNNAPAAGGETTRHQSFHCSRLVKRSRSAIPGTMLTLLCGQRCQDACGSPRNGHWPTLSLLLLGVEGIRGGYASLPWWLPDFCRQAQAAGCGNRVRAGADAQFGADCGNVVLHRPGREVQPPGDLR
jgi:hypothetical protein